MQCQWKAIALPSSSWYRKASGVVVHWRCWLVQAIRRHQAQVSSKITLHACHDCTVATSKFQPRSTRSSGARKLTDNFYWFSQHAVLRQVHHSEPHDPSCKEKLEKNHTSKSCSFVVSVESNCKLKHSRWGILLNTEKGQTWQQLCQHALWTFTWQGQTPIRLSRASSHDVTMTTCMRAIAGWWTSTSPDRIERAIEPSTRIPCLMWWWKRYWLWDCLWLCQACKRGPRSTEKNFRQDTATHKPTSAQRHIVTTMTSDKSARRGGAPQASY